MHCFTFWSFNHFSNKKVLLRERKRHTACRVVSTSSVVITGYPPGDPAGGYPVWGVPWSWYSPCWDLAGYPPRWTWLGTPLARPGRVPPICPMEFWVMLQSIMGWIPPLWTDRCMDGRPHVKTLPSNHTTYVGGNLLSMIL